LPRSTGIYDCGRKTAKKERYVPTSKVAKALELAYWNVRTMLDTAGSNRPERRSALTAHELSRLNVDISAIREVRFPNEGSLQEHGTGYTHFWSGETCSRKASFSFTFKLENLPPGHSDRITSIFLPMKNKQYATLFSVCSNSPS
jgi:hypothetical protein